MLFDSGVSSAWPTRCSGGPGAAAAADLYDVTGRTAPGRATRSTGCVPARDPDGRARADERDHRRRRRVPVRRQRRAGVHPGTNWVPLDAYHARDAARMPAVDRGRGGDRLQHDPVLGRQRLRERRLLRWLRRARHPGVAGLRDGLRGLPPGPAFCEQIRDGGRKGRQAPSAACIARPVGGRQRVRPGRMARLRPSIRTETYYAGGPAYVLWRREPTRAVSAQLAVYR